MVGVTNFFKLQEYYIRKLLHVLMPSNTQNILYLVVYLLTGTFCLNEKKTGCLNLIWVFEHEACSCPTSWVCPGLLISFRFCSVSAIYQHLFFQVGSYSTLGLLLYETLHGALPVINGNIMKWLFRSFSGWVMFLHTGRKEIHHPISHLLRAV